MRSHSADQQNCPAERIYGEGGHKMKEKKSSRKRSIMDSAKLRIIALFCGVVVVFSSLLYGVGYYFTNSINQQVVQSVYSVLPLFVRGIDSALDDLRNHMISNTLTNQDMEALNKAGLDDFDINSQAQSIRIKLNKDKAVYDNADFLFYYSQVNDIYISSQTWRSENREDIIKSLIHASSQSVGDYRWKLIEVEGECKLVYVFTNGLGYYLGGVIDVGKLFDVGNAKDKLEMFILDESGNPLNIYGQNSDEIPRLNISSSSSGQEIQTVTFTANRKKYTAVSQALTSANIVCALMVDEASIAKNAVILNLMIAVVSLLMIVAVALFFLSVRQYLFKPVNTLTQGMEQLAAGNMDIRLNETGLSEFRTLINNFNSMTERIKKLTQELIDERIQHYEEKMKSKNMMLNHLRLQINPHFLSNSLCIVYNLTFTDELDTIRKLTLHMSKYFRYSMQSKNELVEIAREINFINDYLSIQKIRFTRRFDFSIHSAPGTEKCKIPPLTLQPFTENSIVHSMVDLEKNLHISVRVEPDPDNPDYCVIQIQDNGVGISDEMLRILNSPELLEKNYGEHMAIWNILHRLRLFFGEEAETVFSNLPDGGALVRLRLPLKPAV